MPVKTPVGLFALSFGPKCSSWSDCSRLANIKSDQSRLTDIFLERNQSVKMKETIFKRTINQSKSQVFMWFCVVSQRLFELQT